MRVYCRFFVLTNSNIIALFIARFIALGIYSRFSFKDLMIPIRRSLHRLMYVRVYRKTPIEFVKIFDEYKKKTLIQDFRLVKKFLKNRFVFFTINLIVMLSELKMKFNLLYFRKRLVRFLNKKHYKFFEFYNLFERLKVKFCKYNYLFTTKYLVININIKYNKINFFNFLKFYLKKQFNVFINIFIKIFNNFSLLKLFFMFKLNSIKLICVLKIFVNIIVNNLIRFNFKFFYFLLFKKFFSRLYLFTGYFLKDRSFNDYKKLLFNKFLKKQFFINWVFFKIKKMKKISHNDFKNNIVFRIISKVMKKDKVKPRYFLPKYRNDLRKYKLIYKIIRRSFNIKSKDILNLMTFTEKKLKWFIFLLKLKRRQKRWKLSKKKFLRKFRKKFLRKKKKIRERKTEFAFREAKIKDIISRYLDSKLNKRTIYNIYNRFTKINFYYFFLYKKFSYKLYSYSKFPLNIKKIFNYIYKLDDIEFLYNKKFYDINEKLIDLKLENEVMTPLKYKLKRRKYLDKTRAILYGYKFHFKGRFKRKQKSSNLWFLKGAMPNSTMIQEVDRGFFTFYSMFGACTVRVWLYKSDSAPKHLIRVN
jgi:hypothetical protein